MIHTILITPHFTKGCLGSLDLQQFTFEADLPKCSTPEGEKPRDYGMWAGEQAKNHPRTIEMIAQGWRKERTISEVKK
jgi:hypothetical protein